MSGGRTPASGKVERFNRTMADEFLYARVFRSDEKPNVAAASQHWVHASDLYRNHTAIGGPPASRVHNVTGQYS